MFLRYGIGLLFLSLILQLINEYLSLITSYSKFEQISLSASNLLITLSNGPYFPPWEERILFRSPDEATKFVNNEFSSILGVISAQNEQV